MKEKSTPIGTKIFASLSVLNIVATFVCILSVLIFRDNVAGQGLWLNMSAREENPELTRFLTGLKLVADKHGMTITDIDLTTHQINFDGPAENKVEFSVALGEYLESCGCEVY